MKMGGGLGCMVNGWRKGEMDGEMEKWREGWMMDGWMEMDG